MNCRVLATLSIISLTTALFAGAAPAHADDEVPNFEAELDFAPETAGHLVQLAVEDSEALPSPSAVASDEGTVLVTWYGHESEYCDYNPSDLEEACVTVFQVLTTDGEPVSEIKRASDLGAPYYYGAPSAVWNPVAKEWAVYWTSYNDVPNGEGGVYLQRVSRDGELVGETVALPDLVRDPSLTDDPSTDEDETLVQVWFYASNPSLIWMGDEGWLLLNYNELRNGGYVVTQVLLNDDLTPADFETIIANSGWQPYGAFTAYEPSTSTVFAAHLNSSRNGFVARAVRVSAGVVSVSDELAIIQDSSENPVVRRAPGVAYISSEGKFAMSYVSRVSVDDSTFDTLNLVSIELGEDVMTDATDIEVSDPVVVYQSPLRHAQRSWLGFDAETNRLYVSQSYNEGFSRTDEEGRNWYYGFSIAVIHEVDPSDFSLIESVRIGEAEAPTVADGLFDDFYRSATRISMNQTGNSLTYAYMSWIDQGWGEIVEVRFGVVSAYGSTQLTPPAPQASSFSGPVLQTQRVTAAAGTSVSLKGSNLGSVTKVEIDGIVCEVVSVADGELVIRLPQGLTAGLKNVVLHSSAGKVEVQDVFLVTAAASQAEGMRPSVKRLSDGSAKVWVFDAFGAGKVQIMLNGKEVAWVNAASADDPKLRSGRLVRTLPLVDGKNVIEVWVAGERVHRVAYTR